MKVLSRIPIIGKRFGDEYTTKVGVWRRRGGSFQFELRDAVRYKYEDRPNAHVLDSEEEIPAVPLEHIYTMTDGTPYFEVIEVEDGQFAPREKLLNDKDTDYEDIEAEIDEIKGSLVPIKAEINEAEMEDTVIQNKDTRLNFWLDHLKESQKKYGAAGLIKENMRVILVVATALSVAIIMYTTGDFSQYAEMFKDLISSVDSLTQAIQTLMQENPDLASGGS